MDIENVKHLFDSLDIKYTYLDFLELSNLVGGRLSESISLGSDLTLVCPIKEKALGDFADEITIFDEGVDQALLLITDSEEGNNLSKIELHTYWLFDDKGKFLKIINGTGLD